MKVDYNKAREEYGFEWKIGMTAYALLEEAGITLSEYNRNPTAGVEIYKDKYYLRLKERFGDFLNPPGIATPPVSYGHINFLGINLVFPEGEGEVNYKHDKKSLEEWIAILNEKTDFSKMTPEARFFLDYRDKLAEAYPGRHVNWSMGYEGPLTTAYELRDMDFFYDIYDQPEKTKEFLEAVALNTVEYIKFHRRINGQPEFSSDGGAMCDDIASNIPPEKFKEFVLPYWEIFYKGTSAGKRHLHSEDHTYRTMKYLEDARITFFDPSISHKLNPVLIRDNCRVPFGWRMGSFHFKDLSVTEVRDWVYKAVEDGAGRVFTYITKMMLDDEHVAKIKAFHEASVNAKEMFDKGVSREEIGKLVTPEGRKKFWDRWPE